MMKMQLLITSFVLSFILFFSNTQHVLSFSNGAGSCEVADVVNMPGVANTQTGWGVQVSRSVYVVGSAISVSFSHASLASYAGFLIYALDNNNNKVGQWTPQESVSHYSSRCNNNPAVLTHASPSTKYSTASNSSINAITIHTWMPPSSYMGTLTFTAVVMQADRTYQTISSTIEQPATPYVGLAKLHGTVNSPSFTGLVRFSQHTMNDNNVTVSITIANPINGTFAMHVHTFGDISAANGTASAGHFNPLNVSHACYPTVPRHEGAMIKQLNYSNAPLPQSFTYVRDLIDLSNSTTSIIGRAVMVHASFDDCVTQPNGNSGRFIGQGVIGIPQITDNGVAMMNAARVVLASPPVSAIAILQPTLAKRFHSAVDMNRCLGISSIAADVSSAVSVLSSEACNMRQLSAFFINVDNGALQSLFLLAVPPYRWQPSAASATSGSLVFTQNTTLCLSSTQAMTHIACDGSSGNVTFILDNALPQLTGTVQFQTISPTQVRVVASVSGLNIAAAPYSVAMHVHTYGDETSHNGAAAGTHYDPAATNRHDWPNNTPRHMGAMGNWTVDVSGTINDDRILDLLTLTASTGNIIGRSVVLHIVDDKGPVSPTGNSQGRLAVGVIGISSRALPAATTSTPPTSLPTTVLPTAAPTVSPTAQPTVSPTSAASISPNITVAPTSNMTTVTPTMTVAPTTAVAIAHAVNSVTSLSNSVIAAIMFMSLAVHAYLF